MQGKQIKNHIQAPVKEGHPFQQKTTSLFYTLAEAAREGQREVEIERIKRPIGGWNRKSGMLDPSLLLLPPVLLVLSLSPCFSKRALFSFRHYHPCPPFTQTHTHIYISTYIYIYTSACAHDNGSEFPITLNSTVLYPHLNRCFYLSIHCATCATCAPFSFANRFVYLGVGAPVLQAIACVCTHEIKSLRGRNIPQPDPRR